MSEFKPEYNKELTLKFENGHFNSLNDEMTYDRNMDVIPYGYYHGVNVYIDDKGSIRARPIVEALTKETTGQPIAVIYFNGKYYIITENGTIKYYNGSSWASLSGSPTYNSINGVSVDNIREYQSTTCGGVPT